MARFLAVMFVGLFLASVSFAEESSTAVHSSWGAIKANQPAAKLVVSADPAGGWLGSNHQPYVPNRWFSIVMRRSSDESISRQTVEVINTTSMLISDVEAVIEYDTYTIAIHGITPARSSIPRFIVSQAGRGPLRVTTAFDASYGRLLFTVNIVPTLHLLRTSSTVIRFHFAFYDEEGRVIATQRVRWVVRVE